MKDSAYIATLLGRKIAVQDEQEPSKYRLLVLYGILVCGLAIVGDRQALHFWIVPFESLSDPLWLIADMDKEIIG